MHTPSRRDAGKDRRRARILQAARALIQETGETGVSMRPLAERAGVSVSTTYNLFGSKQAVLAALLDGDIADYETRLGSQNTDALDRFFEAVSLGCRAFDQEPDYYRTVLAAVYGAGSEYRSMFRGPRRAFWKRLVNEAMQAGFLRRDICTEAFATNLVFIYFAAIMEWVSGEMSLIELEQRVLFGFALSLRAIATADSEARLVRLIDHYHSALADCQALENASAPA